MVNWNPPADDGGADIAEYDVQYREQSDDDSNDWTVVDAATNNTDRQYEITGLTNNTTYEIEVRAVNGAGDGDWSATATGEPAFGVSVVPTALTVQEGDDKDYTVVLRSGPQSDVKIIVTSDNNLVTVDADLNTAGVQNSLTFTKDNWYTAQTVEVSAGDDT